MRKSALRQSSTFGSARRPRPSSSMQTGTESAPALVPGTRPGDGRRDPRSGAPAGFRPAIPSDRPRRPARRPLSDDVVVVLLLGDVKSDGGHRLLTQVTLAMRAGEESAQPEGYRLAGVLVDETADHRKSTRLWGTEAGRATRQDRLLVVAPTVLGRRRAIASAALPVDWTWPPHRRPRLPVDQGSR